MKSSLHLRVPEAFRSPTAPAQTINIQFHCILFQNSIYGCLDLQGMFLHQQWSEVEDGEGIRPVAGTENE